MKSLPLVPLPQLVPSQVCFRCDVCCRFPEPDSFLRPYFTAQEVQRAITRGIDPEHFSDPNGCQITVVPHPSGDGYLCPAFDPATSHCRIYEERPLDCQIYPLAVMWSRDHREVVLGWDAKCPFMKDAVPSEIQTYAATIIDRLEQDAMLETFAGNPRLIGRFQEDVVILRSLPRLSARLRATFGVRRSKLSKNLEPRISNLKLRALTLADRVRFERAVVSVETPLAHYALAPHLIWPQQLAYSWAEIAGHFCLFADYTDGCFMPLPPLPAVAGKGLAAMGNGLKGDEPHLSPIASCPSPAALAACFELMRARNGGSGVSRVENVPDEWVVALRALGYSVKPKDPDYLYKTADLVWLAGERYKSQRAACNRFERALEYQCDPYQDTDRDACLELFSAWTAQKRATGEDAIANQMLSDSESAHREALIHHHELGLIGRVVRVNGTIRAYTFGYARSSSVFCVLLEVADRTIPGLAQFIFREFCREAATRGHEFINTMDDSGLPSLAQSKQAYHPVRLVPSYIVTEP